MKTPLGAVLQGVLQALTRHQSRASRTSYDLVKRVHHSCAMSHDFAHPEGVIRKISLRASMVPHRCQCASEDRALQ